MLTQLFLLHPPPSLDLSQEKELFYLTERDTANDSKISME